MNAKMSQKMSPKMRTRGLKCSPACRAHPCSRQRTAATHAHSPYCTWTAGLPPHFVHFKDEPKQGPESAKASQICRAEIERGRTGGAVLGGFIAAFCVDLVRPRLHVPARLESQVCGQNRPITSRIAWGVTSAGGGPGWSRVGPGGGGGPAGGIDGPICTAARLSANERKAAGGKTKKGSKTAPAQTAAWMARPARTGRRNRSGRRSRRPRSKKFCHRCRQCAEASQASLSEKLSGELFRKHKATHELTLPPGW